MQVRKAMTALPGTLRAFPVRCGPSRYVAGQAAGCETTITDSLQAYTLWQCRTEMPEANEATKGQLKGVVTGRLAQLVRAQPSHG
jgi:hypothetical protein